MAKKKHLPCKKMKALPTRNPLHNHPLLSKGGMHAKSNKAIRRKEHIAIKKEWLPQNIFSRVFFNEPTLTDCK